VGFLPYHKIYFKEESLKAVTDHPFTGAQRTIKIKLLLHCRWSQPYSTEQTKCTRSARNRFGLEYRKEPLGDVIPHRHTQPCTSAGNSRKHWSKGQRTCYRVKRIRTSTKAAKEEGMEVKSYSKNLPVSYTGVRTPQVLTSVSLSGESK